MKTMKKNTVVSRQCRDLMNNLFFILMTVATISTNAFSDDRTDMRGERYTNCSVLEKLYGSPFGDDDAEVKYYVGGVTTSLRRNKWTQISKSFDTPEEAFSALFSYRRSGKCISLGLP